MFLSTMEHLESRLESRLGFTLQYSYEIGYEMYGKDLIESANLSGKINAYHGQAATNRVFL